MFSNVISVIKIIFCQSKIFSLLGELQHLLQTCDFEHVLCPCYPTLKLMFSM